MGWYLRFICFRADNTREAVKVGKVQLSPGVVLEGLREQRDQLRTTVPNHRVALDRVSTCSSLCFFGPMEGAEVDFLVLWRSSLILSDSPVQREALSVLLHGCLDPSKLADWDPFPGPFQMLKKYIWYTHSAWVPKSLSVVKGNCSARLVPPLFRHSW